MSVSFSVELLNGTYDAAKVDDRERAEWPPHPARLFCALVAAARTEPERAALAWLETCPPPLIIAAGAAGESRRVSYVVTNSLDKEGGNLTHLGRTNGLWARTRALPTSPRVTVTFDGDAGAEVVAALDETARRVPYLGRSTGIALVAAAATNGVLAVGPDVGRVLFEPCDPLEQETSLRVPYPGFLAELDVQFAADRPAWEASLYQGYRRRRGDTERVHGPEHELVASVYTELLPFRFSGLAPQVDLAVRFTESLRSAVLSAAGRSAPQALHGHGADGRPHVAFLALPNVGNDHADGHLLGLAVAVPDLPVAERDAVVRAVLGLRGEDGLARITVPGIGGVELMYRSEPETYRPWGASRRRWRQGSTRWVTATPMVLDRFPKRPELFEAEVRTSLRRVGLPEPVEVEISTEPLLTGAARLKPNDLPRQARGRIYRHVAVRFDRPVAGPVLAGAGRYLGVGLFAPITEPTP